jgi:hypothetical protein
LLWLLRKVVSPAGGQRSPSRLKSVFQLLAGATPLLLIESPLFSVVCELSLGSLSQFDYFLLKVFCFPVY